MSEEANGFILGAIVGLLSAVVTFILTAVYDLYKDGLKRQREIDDRNYYRHIAALDKRLGEATDLVSQQFDIASKLTTYQIEAMSNKARLEDLAALEEISSMLIEVTKNSYSIQNLNDDTLNLLTTELIQINSQELMGSRALFERIVKDKVIDKEKESERLHVFMLRVTEIKKKILKRVDELSGLNT